MGYDEREIGGFRSSNMREWTEREGEILMRWSERQREKRDGVERNGGWDVMRWSNRERGSGGYGK